MPDVIRQRRFGVRTSFCFGPDAMTYGIGDWNSMNTQTVPYELMDLTSRSDFTLGNTGYVLRWAWVLIVALYGFQLVGLNSWTGSLIIAGFVISAGMVAVLMLELTAVSFTDVATLGADASGVRRFVRVIQDRRHDAILAELEVRWRDRLRRLYGPLRLEADPEQEAGRQAWLHRLGVISDDELRSVLGQLRAAARAPGEPHSRLH